MTRPASVVLLATVLVCACSKTGPSTSGNDTAVRESASASEPAEAAPKVRTIRFTYETIVAAIPDGTKELRIWVPAPQEAPPLQSVSSMDLRAEGISNARISSHGAGINRWWHVCVQDPVAPVKLVATMTVTRREQLNNYFRGAGNVPLTEAEREKFKEELGPYDLVPVGGRITGLSSTIGGDEKNVVNAARRIYDYVLDHMRYSKEGTGWGNGDTLWACDSGYGNCTDFHSLFMSIAKAKGIPARFHMGFPIPDQHGEGKVAGYHCWAEFFVSGMGWVPVDISEADKHPELSQYYFGALTEDRIAFMTGRDLALEPAPASGKRNLFIYPYAEADGKEVKTDKAFAYQDA